VVSTVAETPPKTATATDRAEYQAGWQAAEADMKRGVVRYRAIGLITPDWDELTREAKARYNVELVSHGCAATYRAKGYLDAVVQHLIAQYGRDPIFELHRTLMKKYSGPQ
jgi:hypothetical protein